MNDFSKFRFACTWKQFEKDWVGMVLNHSGSKVQGSGFKV